MKFNHTGHKELWDWLSKNPDQYKDNWEGWKHNGGQYEVSENFCFMKDGTAAFSLYEEWVIEPDLQFKSKLAAQIRDLPVRDGVECE